MTAKYLARMSATGPEKLFATMSQGRSYALKVSAFGCEGIDFQVERRADLKETAHQPMRLWESKTRTDLPIQGIHGSTYIDGHNPIGSSYPAAVRLVAERCRRQNGPKAWSLKVRMGQCLTSSRVDAYASARCAVVEV